MAGTPSAGVSPFGPPLPNGRESNTQATSTSDPGHQIGIMDIGPSSNLVPNDGFEVEPAYLNGKFKAPKHVK